jgi:hypothetical protein
LLEKKTKSRKFWKPILALGFCFGLVIAFSGIATAETAEECYAKLNPMQAATTQQDCITCCKTSGCTSLTCIQKMDALKKSSTEYQTYVDENITKPNAQSNADITATLDKARADNPDYYASMDAVSATDATLISKCVKEANGDTSNCATCCGANTNCQTSCANYGSIKTPAAIVGDTTAAKTTTSTSTTKNKTGSTLQLLESASPDKVPHFTDSYISTNWKTNDALITNLVKDSLIARLIVIAKYILGGVFMLYLGLYVITFLGSASKDEALKKFKDQMIWAFTGFLILALAEPFSQALSLMSLGSNSDSLLANPATTQISATLVGYSFRSAGRLIQYILGGVALLTMGISAFRMITAVGDEETVKNSRKSLVWASIGLLIAGATTILVDNVIAPNVTLTGADAITQHAALLAQSGIQAKIFVLNYVKYFQTFIGAMAVFMLFLAGFKMVAAGGEEEIITKQKKMITWIFLGLLIILVSEVFVTIFMPATGGLGDTQIASFSAQLGGFTNFLLTFSAILAVLAMVVGGLYLSTAAFNAEQAEKGKKIMLAAALGLVLTISAYALVNTVLSSTTSSGTMIDVKL